MISGVQKFAPTLAFYCEAGMKQPKLDILPNPNSKPLSPGPTDQNRSLKFRQTNEQANPRRSPKEHNSEILARAAMLFPVSLNSFRNKDAGTASGFRASWV